MIQIYAIYLDYSKAFDKVDHNLLLMKLHSYGIRGKLHDWLTAYLQNRSQFVVVNGEKSYPAEVKSGVPQGSVLGPLLFILYLNDLHSYINHSTVRSFADDTRILKEIKNTNDIISCKKTLIPPSIGPYKTTCYCTQTSLNISAIVQVHQNYFSNFLSQHNTFNTQQEMVHS